MKKTYDTHERWQGKAWLLQLLILAGLLFSVMFYTAPGWCPDLPSVGIHSSPAQATAWNRVVPRLQATDKTDQATEEAMVTHVQSFFRERRARARAFAEEVLGLHGKFVFIKSKLPFTDPDSHQKFLRERFDAMVLSGPELQAFLESVVASYLTQLQGHENALLVSLRADLGEGDLAPLRDDKLLQTEETFRRAYAGVLERLSAGVAGEMKYALLRDGASLLAGDLATNLIRGMAVGLAQRSGVSVAILGSGVASSVATLGLSVVVGYLVDQLFDWILQALGFDQAGEVANKVSHALTQFESVLLDGEPQAVRAYRQLCRMREGDWFEFVREECARAAARVEKSGCLGLRHELLRVRELRGQLRKATLRKLILEGGAL